MASPLSGAGRVTYIPPASEIASSAGAGFQRAVQEVRSLDIPMDGRHEAPGQRSLITAASDRQYGAMKSIANSIDSVIRTGDAQGTVATLTKLIDKSVTDDLTAKVIGKGISTIDQLTKLT